MVWSGDRKPDKWTGRVPAIQSTVDLEKATYTNSVGSTELKRSGPIPSSMPACMRSITPACWRFPRRAGRSFRP